MGFSKIPLKSIRAVFSDLDDTMTEQSLLPSSVVKSLETLHEKNYWLVIVSGRPAGWADCLVRLLPIDAVIFENGAGMMLKEKNKITTRTLAKDLDIISQKEKLDKIFRNIQQRIPQAKLATDQPYRLFDYAIDFGEEPPFLPEAQIDEMLNILKKEKGITAKLSSIHINYWCGEHTKVTAIQELLKTDGIKRGIEKKQVVFSGDSPNDEPLFEYFDYSVGVANIQKYLPRIKSQPTEITNGHGGSGFVELVNALLKA